MMSSSDRRRLAFTFGLGGLAIFPLRFGATATLLENAAPPEMVRIIETYKATICFYLAHRVPAMMAAMDKGADLSSLRLAVSAGETLPAPVFESWTRKTGKTILDGIGLYGMLHIFITNRVGDAVAERPEAGLGLRGKFVHLVVERFLPRSRDRLPGLSRTASPTRLVMKDVQHFRRADAVENRLACLAVQLRNTGAGKVSPAENRKAQRRQIGALVHRGHHRPVRGGRGKADRGLVGFNDPDHLGRRCVFQQRRGGAEPQWKDSQDRRART